MSRLWSKEDDDKLREWAQNGIDDGEIAERLNRTKVAIRSRRETLRLLSPKCTPWTVEELDILIECAKKGLPDRETAKRIPARTHQAIRCKRQSLHLNLQSGSWSPADDARLIAARKNDISVADIAKMLDRTKPHVMQRLRELGQKRRPPLSDSFRPWTPEILVAMYEADKEAFVKHHPERIEKFLRGTKE